MSSGEACHWGPGNWPECCCLPFLKYLEQQPWQLPDCQLGSAPCPSPLEPGQAIPGPAHGPGLGPQVSSHHLPSPGAKEVWRAGCPCSMGLPIHLSGVALHINNGLSPVVESKLDSPLAFLPACPQGASSLLTAGRHKSCLPTVSCPHCSGGKLPVWKQPGTYIIFASLPLCRRPFLLPHQLSASAHWFL